MTPSGRSGPAWPLSPRSTASRLAAGVPAAEPASASPRGSLSSASRWGPAIAQEHDAIGETPNLAARLQAVAAPGEVVIAASTRRLVGRMFDCRALGAIELKGLPQPVEAWQVRGETAGVSRFEARHAGALSPLVGRQEEIELLLRRWHQAKAGEGRVVLLSGEPGIGKSRIAESLLVQARGRAACAPALFLLAPPHAQRALPVHCAARAGRRLRAGQRRRSEARQAGGPAQANGEKRAAGSGAHRRAAGGADGRALPGVGGQPAAEARDDAHRASRPARRHCGAEAPS